MTNPQSTILETPKSTNISGLASSTRHTAHVSPSQRLKDLFFATYTNSPTQSKNPSFTDPSVHAVQTPTKAKKARLTLESDMDVDSNPAQISESDLSGPTVPLAISSSGRFYSDHMRRCELQIELMGLHALGHCPRGMYIMPSLDSINVWYGVLFMRLGYWKDSVIRFRIDIPREYPNRHPIISLITRVFHPLVRREDGRFALEQQFPTWTPYGDYIFHALFYFKNAFKNSVLRQLEPKDCFNIDAYMMFRGDLPRFREFARSSAMASHRPEVLYAPQEVDCPIVFNPLSDNQYEQAMDRIKAFATEES